MLSDIEWAYLAGLVDGEGCIHMSNQKNYLKKTEEYTVYYYPQFILRMTTGSWENIVRRTGLGMFYSRESKNRPITEWRVCRPNEVIKLLRSLLPYLQVKHQEAIDMVASLTTGLRSNYINPNKRIKH